HTAVSEQGEPLGIVHRDFTPQNIMVGADGVPRVVDFGVARARGRLQSTVDGQVKGKPAYMAPEQVTAGPIDARTDVFAAGVVLWEALTLRRLFSGDNEAASMYKVLHGHVDPPSRVVSWVPAAFDKIVQRALRRDPAERFPSAKHMADAIEAAVPFASPSKVQAWVEHCAASALAVRAEKVASAETPAETAPAQARTTIINNNSESTPSAVNAAVSRGSKAKTVLGFGSAVLAAGALGAVAMNAAGSPERMPQLAVSPLKAMRFPQMAVPPAASSSGGVEALPKPLSRAKPQPPRAPVKAKVRVKPDNCDPPFVVDARGVRTFKRECL
nr:serine/threonine-protein kinase [Polyangiaceae bacterium]